MTEISPAQPSPEAENFLSAAYGRILRLAIALSIASAALSGFVWGWGSGLALGMGAVVACLNFVWLHRGADLVIQRMLHPGVNRPAQHRIVFAFAIRHILVFAAAYVILKGYPRTRVGFMVGLSLPIIAAMCEGIYEAVKIKQTDQV